MRRREKEIQDRRLIDQIIAQAQVCRLGLCRDNVPYVVPVCFGYDGRAIYFHTAGEGMKIDFMAANPQACFELEHEVQVIANEKSACGWSVSFYSVIGWGTVNEVVDPGGKRTALNQIMGHYSGREWEFDSPSLEGVRVWRLDIGQVTGKRSKDKRGGRF